MLGAKRGGIEPKIVRTIAAPGWKWTVEFPAPRQAISGETTSGADAMKKADRVVEAARRDNFDTKAASAFRTHTSEGSDRWRAPEPRACDVDVTETENRRFSSELS